jgi:hypothetical protein
MLNLVGPEVIIAIQELLELERLRISSLIRFSRD